MNPKFWSGKRVFLTGHTGFKGSWLSLWLQSLNATLTGYALDSPTDPSLFETARVGNGMRSIISDIRNLEAIKHEMAAAEPEIVIHMAAQPLVRHSYVNPVETYSTNVMGTVHILEAVRHVSSVRAVINVTSDKCYANQEWVWGYRENEPMGGHDPYSNSKGCAELVTAAYRASFFQADGNGNRKVAIATARAGNVIGGGDWADDRLISDVMRAFQDGGPVVVRKPNAIRPWQHVLESLRGYLTLAEKLYAEGPAWSEAWNFGPNGEDAKTVAWIVDYLVNKWGHGAGWMVDDRSNPHEANYLKLDVSKARMRLGWQPVLSLEQSLGLVTDWHRAHIGDADMRRFTIEQIQQYSDLSRSLI